MGGYDSETWASRIQGNRALFLCRAAATFWSGIRVAGNAAAAGRRIVLLCFRRFGAVRYGGAFCAAGSSRRICLWPFSIGHIALVDSRDRLRRVGIGFPTGLTGARRYSVDRPSRTKIGRATSELQSLMRISYAVFCLKKKT